MPFARISLLALLAVTGCGARQSDAPVRSPSLDYPPPPAQTSDGEVVGVDRVPPGDRLQQGPKVGTEGVKPAAGPAGAGGAEQSGAGKPSPCTDIGLEDARGQSRCKKPPPK
jgi:hypothetical protein